LKYFAFSDQTFDCSKDGHSEESISKPLIILSIVDSETGEDKSDQYTATIFNPKGSTNKCQVGCELIEEIDDDDDGGFKC